VKKVVRTVLISLVAILGIAGIGILSANLYIQSKPTQQKIERKLSGTLRLPLEIQRTSLTPWGGLSITGITVPQSPAVGGNFLDAQECSIHFQFFPLFRRKLVIDQILLDEPKVVWVQNASGRWAYPWTATTAPLPEPAPGPVQPPAPVETPSESPAPEPPPVAPSVSPVPEPPAVSPPPPVIRLPVEAGRPFEIVLSRLKIENGSFDFSDAAGRRVALFTDVDVEVPTAKPDFVEGTANCEKISFRDCAFVEELKTHFSYSKERLALSDLKARLADGTVNGTLEVKTSVPKSPFTADVKFEKVDLNRLIAEAGGPWNQADGSLSGFLDIYGQAGDVNSITGSGRLEMTNGQVNQFQVLQMLGKVLQIEELSQLDLQRASASWRIENGVIRVDQLVLQSANLRLTAQGTVQLNGQLDLNANLAINRKISRQLPDFIEANFKPVENSDLRALDFKIFGTTSKPRTDLGTRVLGADIEKKVEKRAVDILHNLFGGRKRKTNNQPATPPPANP
jgi:type II secretion system protein N